MMGLVATLVFAGGFAFAAGVIVGTAAPQWRRIVRLAAGRVETPHDAECWRSAAASRSARLHQGVRHGGR